MVGSFDDRLLAMVAAVFGARAVVQYGLVTPVPFVVLLIMAFFTFIF